MAKTWDLKVRTMEFAGATFKFCRRLPQTDEARDAARQLRRAASSVAANYRARCRSGTDRVFASKTDTLIEEADEAGCWLQLLTEIELVTEAQCARLKAEANEPVAIFVASKKRVTARLKAAKESSGRPSDF